MTKKLFSDKEFYNKLLRLALPIILQNLMLAAVAASDALMLGSLQQDAMSAVSLASQIQFIQNMILASIITAASILAAQYWGKGDTESVKKVFAISFRLSLLADIIFWALCFFTPNLLMVIFTDEEELVSKGIAYLRIAGWSYLFTGISQTYLALLKVTDRAKESALVSSGTVILNIILNAIFIYGLFTFPSMGIKGAATATLIARVIELIWSFSYSLRKDFVSLPFKNLISFSKLLSYDFAKCALPLLGACLFWGVGFTSYTAFMGHLGKDAAGANSIAAVVRDLVCCFCNGIGSGGGIMVGNELGAGKTEKGKLYGDKLLKISVIIGFISTLIMLLLTPLVMAFVKLTPQAHKLLFGMMIIMAIYMIGRTINTVVINGIFAAGGDTLFDMYSLAVVMWGLAIPLAALGTFVFNWAVLLVYACTCVDEVGKIPWVIFHYKKYKWVKDLTRS